MKIVISGYYGSGNAGDEAILDAILEALTNFNPNIEVTVISINPHDTRRSHSVNAISHLDIFAIIKAISNADLLISGGGSLLQNITSRRSLYYYLGIITLALIFRCPIMLYAQGIGPICGSIARSLTALVLNHVDLITVRDQGSMTELSKLKVTRPKIFCTADPAMALQPASLEFGKQILIKDLNSNSAEDVKLIGVAVRRWQGFDRFKFQLANALNDISKSLKIRVIFISMQPSLDVSAAEEIVNLTSEVECTLLSDQYSTRQLLSLVGCTDLLIGIRLHALIFAGVQNVPLLGISYDPKIDRFLDSIDEVPVGFVESINSSDIVKAVLNKFNNDDIVTAESTVWKSLKDKASLNAALALDLIRNK